MKRRIFFGLLLILIIVGVVGILFLMGAIKPASARLSVESVPAAIVYVDGEEVGITPFERDYQSHEVVIKLVPQAETPLSPYEVKVNLTAGVKTIIRRNIGETIESSSGEIISFEKESGSQSTVSVVSTPDGAQVKLDGQIRGVAPIKVTDLPAGVHQLSVSALGYDERNISIQTVKGYRLTAVVALSVNGQPTQPDLSQPQPTDASSSATVKDTKKVVEILTTPTGFLRVRSEPATSSEEVGRATPGKQYDYLEEDAKKAWIKIILDKDTSGWVSSEYASVSAQPAN